jgi:hypothetical protein
MWRASDEQELGPDRDHVGSHVGSAPILKVLCPGLATVRHTNPRERQLLTLLRLSRASGSSLAVHGYGAED